MGTSAQLGADQGPAVVPEPPSYHKFLKFIAPDVDDNKVGKKTYLWITDKDDCFVRVELVSETATHKKVVDQFGNEKTVEAKHCFELNPEKFDGVEDLGQLTYLNEPAVLDNLRKRYVDNRIHTYSGLFLVVINPYKKLPIYSQEIVDYYAGKRRQDIAPHVFTIADEAYRTMLNTRRNQSILITGESGAGKTENTKKVIAYLTSISGRSGKHQLEEQILKANPILEAFGNARTVRNDNSSRFGKFIQMQFTTAGGIAGASIEHYLLEQSRVVQQNKGERNYHIFYQLLSGLKDTQKIQYRLKTAHEYEYLNKSECFTVESIDDAAEFRETANAMEVMGFGESERESIFRIVAAILHLGNVTFTQNKQDQASVSNKADLETAALLLRLNAEDMERALVKKKIQAPGQVIVTDLNQDQAAFARDAVVKGLYSRMFDWIVKRINKTIDHDEKKSFFIGVLDIAGFEIFKDNSLEQLAINYTNEKLQQFFNQHMFKLEQEEYAREKIQWDYIDFGLDLQATIDMVEKSGGLLAILDEECIFPKATDRTFVEKCHRNFSSEAVYSVPRIGADQLFTIKHYAGEVTYNAQNWLSKNMNPMTDDITTLMQSSEDAFVQNLFWAKKAAAAVGAKKTQAKEKVLTVVGNHKTQLFSLMDLLGSTDPYFIRCLKPNAKKQPGELENALILDQLRCNGVLEGIRIARKGYPNRVPFADFVKRYKMLVPEAKRPKDPREAVVYILDTIKFDKQFYQVGRTKVFFKVGTLGQLESLRDAALTLAAEVLQARMRGFQVRKKLGRRGMEVEAAKVIQRNVRIWLSNQRNKWFKLYRSIHPLLKPNRVENELREKTEQLQQATIQRERLEKDVASLTAEKDTIIRELFGAKADRDKISASKEQLEKELQSVQENLVQTRSSLHKQLVAAQQKTEELQTSLTKETAKSSSLEKKIKQLEDRVRELEGQLEEAQAALAQKDSQLAKLNAQVQELTQTVATREAEIQTEKKKSTKLESELAAEQRETQALRVAKADLERDRDGVQANLDAAKEQLEIEKQNREKLAQSKKQLEAKVQDLTQELEGTTEGKAKVEGAQQRLSSEIAAVQEQLEAANAKVTTLESRRTQLEAQQAKLEDQLAAEGREKQALKTSVAALKAELEQAGTRLEEEQGQRAAREKEKKKLQGDLSDLTERFEAEQRARGAADKERARLDEALAASRREIEELRSANAALNNANIQINEELEETKEALFLEQKNTSAQEKQIKKLQYAIDTLKEEMDATASTGKQSERFLRSDLEAAREQLESEASARQRLQQLNSELEQQIKELMKKSEGLSQSKVAELKRTYTEQIDALKAQLDEITADRDGLKKAKDKAEGGLRSASEELQRVTAERVAKDQAAKKAEAERDALKQELEAEKKNSAAAAALAATFESEVKKLKLSEEEAITSAKKNLARQKASLQVQIDQANSDLEAAQAETTKLKRESQRQVAELTEELAKEKEARKDAEAARTALTDENRKLKHMSKAPTDDAKLSDLKKQISELEERVAEVQGQLDNEVKERKKQQKRADDAVAEAQATEAKLRSHLSKSKSADSDLSAAVQRAESEATAAALARKERDKALADLASLKAEAEPLQAAASKADKALKAALKDLDVARQELEEEERASSKAKQQFKSLEIEFKELEARLAEATDARKALEARVAGVDSQTEELRQQNEQLQGDLARAEKKAATKVREMEDLQEAQEAEKENNRKATQKLKKKFQEEIDDLTVQLEKVRGEKAKLTRDYRNLEKDLSSTKARLSEMMAGQ
eukprot:TRINITY_DN448_c0_g1_i1.p1 TRINITY_DN448_c0_g1~~TRINITY_DN448_c0_g1_i1.p1  ORF type:complete len:1798 (-),score=640.82 TRINITY_DN448_c0_g1_i1:131-5497(-)